MQKQNLGINSEQQIFLCQFMTEHNDLAKGILKTAQGRATTNSLWTKLTEKLNEKGPPLKQKLEWKKTWSDLKYKTKSKLIFNKRSKSKTGGGPYQEKILSEVDELIIQCAGLEAAVSGLAKAKTFGCPQEASENNSNLANDCLNNDNEIAGTEISGLEIYGIEDTINENIAISGNKRGKNKKEDALKKRDEYMERYTKAAEEINRNLNRLVEKNKEKLKYLKRQNETQEKIYKIMKQNTEDKKERGKQKLLLQQALLDAKLKANKLKEH